MDISEVLERIAKEARSNKHGFKVVDKLEAVKNLLEETSSKYHLIYQGTQTWIFGQKDISKGDNVLLVSTHADIVDEIKNPSSSLDTESKYFKGTYDNLGTNGVCASLMVNEELPENVVFAFNADEETGRCNGAAAALEYVRSESQKEPTILALDVTDEGYDNDRLFTIEGLHGVSEFARRKMLEIFMSTEGEKQSFEVVRLKKKDDNSFLPESYRNKELTVFDESVYYAKQNCNSCSLCLPGDGAMHSDSGFYVKEGVMRGYEKSLLANIYAFTKTNPEKLEELKAEKDKFVEDAKSTPFKKLYSYYQSSIGAGGSYTSYSPSSFSYGVATPRNSYGMSMTEWEEMMEYNGSYDSSNNGFDDFEKDYMLEQAMNDAYEIAESYDRDEFDIFFQDLSEMYGFEETEEIELTMKEIFESVQDYKIGIYDDENNVNIDM